MSVPQLRFKEFSAAWQVKKLGDIADLTSSKRVYLSDYVNEGIPFYRGKEISELKRNEKPKEILYITRKSYESFKTSFGVPQVNDILITAVGTLGNVYRIKDESEFYFKDGNLIWLRGIKISPAFMEILLETNQEAIQKSSIGSTQRALTIIELKKLTFNAPTLTEQTKIANFLTAVDEKITHLARKYDLLAQYKKGVMQQIFSQELRFKDDDGRDFPEWEKKAIGDIFTFIQTNSFSRELLNYKNGTVKNIHYGDIHTKYKSNFKIESEKVPFINSTVDISRIPDACYCKEGDLVIADASEDYADIGKAIEIINLGNQKLLSGLHTYIARDLSKQMASGFSGYLMQSEAVRLQVKTLATGVSVLGISKGNLTKVKLNVPSKAEQIKIANFLTAIDDKITQTKSQLAAVKHYKKGLLQQMFV